MYIAKFNFYTFLCFQGDSPFGKSEAYIKLEQLGEGSYATVFKGFSKWVSHERARALLNYPYFTSQPPSYPCEWFIRELYGLRCGSAAMYYYFSARVSVRTRKSYVPEVILPPVRRYIYLWVPAIQIQRSGIGTSSSSGSVSSCIMRIIWIFKCTRSEYVCIRGGGGGGKFVFYFPENSPALGWLVELLFVGAKNIRETLACTCSIIKRTRQISEWYIYELTKIWSMKERPRREKFVRGACVYLDSFGKHNFMKSLSVCTYGSLFRLLLRFGLCSSNLVINFRPTSDNTLKFFIRVNFPITIQYFK